MEETGVLENLTSLRHVLPDFEPGLSERGDLAWATVEKVAICCHFSTTLLTGLARDHNPAGHGVVLAESRRLEPA